MMWPVALVPAQVAPISTVAVSGQPAPEMPAGVTFSQIDFAFGFGYLNNTGQVAFLSFATGPGITGANDRGIWVGRPGALALAAREGNLAPDLPDGVVYATLNEAPNLSGDGAVSFRATLAGPGVTGANDDALFGGTNGAIRLAALEGDLAPGELGTTYAGFTGSPVNSFHQLAFGGVTGAGVETIWFGAPGSISRSTSVGDPADGFLPGVAYADLDIAGAQPVALNSAGQIVFSGRVVGPGIGAANDDALWGGLPLSPHLIARAGNGAPGGGAFSSFPNFVISDSGLAAFQAFLVGAPSGSFGIYREIIGAAESLDKVALEGEAAPSAGGATFNAEFGMNGNFVPRLNNINDIGYVAFRSRLSGTGVTVTNDVGIWGHNDLGVLSLLAREGNSLPAAGTNVFIGTINATPPALNSANRITFRAMLAGTGVSAANDAAIIAANGLGELVLAAREGQAIEISPGVFRTVTGFGNITGPGTQDGASTSWNDHCQLLFRATLSDGNTGLFIADVNATCRPVVTNGPAPQNVALGTDAEFSVAVAEPAGVSYRWLKDGAELSDGATGSGSVLSGATNATLHVLGCGPADAGNYRVVASNVCGQTTSSLAALTLNLGSITAASVPGGSLHLTWSGAPGIQLESATNLTPPITWTVVPGSAGASFTAIPMTAPQMFFRLATP